MKNLMAPFYGPYLDEFEITGYKYDAATKECIEIRLVTRNNISSAKRAADGMLMVGYELAEVVNTYGGHRSDIEAMSCIE
ncbi:MAG: hypothetical protein KGH64_00660 [Candidatus Micrarchaeota archaeon]|nr:hypothetical protein [Candidatus Micrarchaeota archaeon]